jgi:hypothetical protein
MMMDGRIANGRGYNSSGEYAREMLTYYAMRSFADDRRKLEDVFTPSEVAMLEFAARKGYFPRRRRR